MHMYPLDENRALVVDDDRGDWRVHILDFNLQTHDAFTVPGTGPINAMTVNAEVGAIWLIDQVGELWAISQKVQQHACSV